MDVMLTVCVLRVRNNGLVTNTVSPKSLGQGTSLALVGKPPSDLIIIKVQYGIDVQFHR